MKNFYLVSKVSHIEYCPMEVVQLGQYETKNDALNACMKDKDWVLHMEEVSDTQFRNFDAINGKEVIYTISEVTCPSPSVDPLLSETLINFGVQFIPKLCRLSVKNDETYDANEACVRIAILAKQFEDSLNWEENMHRLDYTAEVEKFVNSHIEELYKQVRV